MVSNGVWVFLPPKQKAAEKALMSKTEAGLKAIVKNLNEQLVVQPHPEFGYVHGFLTNGFVILCISNKALNMILPMPFSKKKYSNWEEWIFMWTTPVGYRI